MELWDKDAIDLVGPSFIEFSPAGNGRFRFIAVEGHLGYRDATAKTPTWSWEGNDEGDPAMGRGWAQLETDGARRGHVFFHAGDDSGFRAIARGKP